MIPQQVYNLCHASESLSTEYAKDPSQSPGEIIKKLYGNHPECPYAEKEHPKESKVEGDDLQRAFECGKWGSTRPSDLFLRIYHDALCTLSGDPMVGMTSPALMGSSGVMPLTVLAPLPDICRHLANCIVRAEKEVFLATNFWIASDSATLITNAFRELSRRAGERGEKVVVKVIYDRGNPKQVIDNHQPVPPSEYSGAKVRIPPPEEIPHIDMQVVNYHRPLLGTFHSKYMVVDRKIAILCSNNIQDNDNVEMMTHMEGPIVDSFYDVCLSSWFNHFDPPLPARDTPASLGGFPAFQDKSFSDLFDNEAHLKSQWKDVGKKQDVLADGSKIGYEGQDASAGGNAMTLEEVTEVGHRERLPELTVDDEHYDVDIAGEVRRMQSVYAPREGETHMQAISRHFNVTAKQQDVQPSAPECPPEEEMTPYIPHPTHEPFPIAMVCRKPWGTPTHTCVHTPQNASFISAVRNATRTIFIQTPNLNAEPLLPELIAAVKRGITVEYIVCLGYNDAGELLPFQNGTNEMIANRLYNEFGLNEDEKARLKIYNYIAKDQEIPIHNKFKLRSCHVKLLIADSHIGIQGNGNQDTQSWFHSQEVNVMIDSPYICAAWEQALRRNQNSFKYGRVRQEDGCWYDAEGKQAPGAIGVDPGRFSWARGIVGAVQRVRGAGGF